MRKLLVTLISLLSIYTIFGQDSDTNIAYKIDIKKEIGSTTWLYLDKGMEEAEEINASCIILHLNTYGGQVVFADSMRTRILNSEIPIYAFIDNNAASAGALISIACDSIYMRSGGSIGAATVVSQQGEAAPDKYQSYMRSMMRATAESHGKDTTIVGNDTIIKWFRDPAIAEAMVDQSLYVKGVADTGKVLTLTALEAIENGFCEGLAKNIPDVLKLTGHEGAILQTYKATAFDSIKGFLINPVIHGILIMIIIGGLYFELQSPGIGFPLIVSIIAAILYFSPLYIDGLAANWELALFVVGLVLIMLEVFVIPGFGVAGISGIILVVTGLVLSMVGNVVFDFSNVPFEETITAMLTVVLSLVLAVSSSVYITSRLIKNPKSFSFVALTATQDEDKGFIGIDSSIRGLIGKEGVAATVLRPSGRIEISDEPYDAISDDGFIEKGTSVIVTGVDAGQVIVEKKS